MSSIVRVSKVVTVTGVAKIPAAERPLSQTQSAQRPVTETDRIEPSVDSILEEARRQAEAVRTEAAREAQRIREEAMLEAKQVLDSAKAAGWQEGYEAGTAQGRAEAERLIAEAAAVMRQAQEERRRLLADVGPALVQVTMAAVRRLLAREISVQPANVEEMVMELLGYVIDSTRVEVRVHPSDFMAATEAHPRWKSTKFGEWEVAVVPDASITPGGCEIRSEVGYVDARMETKLELLESALSSVMERSVDELVTSMVG